jgi:hypothetical protein
VAAQQQLAAGGERRHHRFNGFGNRPRQAFGGLVLQVCAFEELLLDALVKHERSSYASTLGRSAAVEGTR